VKRWAIRMPQLVGPAPRNRSQNPMVTHDPPRNRLVGVLEQGGEALIGFRQTSSATYVVEGTVFDSSAGRPLGSAAVSLRGTPFSATADALGRFRIQLADTGRYMLTFEHPRLDSLGFDVPSHPVHVAGAVTTADIAIPPLVVVRSALCPAQRGGERTGIVHGIVRSSSGAPLSWATIKYRWAQFVAAPPSGEPALSGASRVPVTTSAPGATFVADSRGRYLICDVPPGRHRLMLESETGEVAETEVVLGAGDLFRRDLTLRRP
jgi:hypothetical protein